MTLCNNLLRKGVSVFSRVDVFSRDYGIHNITVYSVRDSTCSMRIFRIGRYVTSIGISLYAPLFILYQPMTHIPIMRLSASSCDFRQCPTRSQIAHEVRRLRSRSRDCARHLRNLKIHCTISRLHKLLRRT